MNISSNFDQNISRFHEILDVQKNFDIVYHTLTIADKKACLYFIDGFTKDEILLRLMQDFASVKPDSFPSSAHDFAKQYVHYGETTVETDDKNIFTQLLSGLSCLLIDGYDRVSSSTAVLTRPRDLGTGEGQGPPWIPGWLRGDPDLQHRSGPPQDPGRKFHRGDHADRRKLPHGHRHLLHEAPRGREPAEKNQGPN